MRTLYLLNRVLPLGLAVSVAIQVILWWITVPLAYTQTYQRFAYSSTTCSGRILFVCGLLFFALPGLLCGLVSAGWLRDRPLLYGCLVGFVAYAVLVLAGWQRFPEVARCTFDLTGHTEPLPTPWWLIWQARITMVFQRGLPMMIGNAVGLWIGSLLRR